MQRITLHSPVLPGPAFCAAFDPTADHLQLITRPTPSRVIVREIMPFPGAVRAGVPTEYSAEQFLDSCQHLSVCLAVEPRFRATHLYFRAGEVCAIRLVGNRWQEYGDMTDGRYHEFTDETIHRLLEEGIEQHGATARLVPIQWTDPLRFANEAELV